jgi:DNA-binding Lrp family transcriptional regulator
MLTIARNFQSFNNIEQMNYNVKRFVETIKGILPKSVFTTIDFLSTHSCRIKGVSFASYEYMSDMTGLSVSTLKRAVSILVKLGFVVKYTTRVRGKQSSNILVINPEMDLQKVEDLLLDMFSIKLDTPDEPANDMQNDTLKKSDKPSIFKGLKDFLTKGSFKSSSNSIHNINITAPINHNDDRFVFISGDYVPKNEIVLTDIEQLFGKYE